MIYFVRRHAPWLSSLAVGILLIVVGMLFIIQGKSTRDDIRDELRAEQVMTSQDASIPGVLVRDEETARAQADAIKKHTLGTWGPYSELPRDDPRRAQFIDGVALRTALNMAVVGFKITDLVIAAGAILLLAGIATVALATPALYLLAGMVAGRPTAATPGRPSVSGGT